MEKRENKKNAHKPVKPVCPWVFLILHHFTTSSTSLTKFKNEAPVRNSLCEFMCRKKINLVWWSTNTLSLFNYPIYFLFYHFKTSLIINSELLTREQKFCTMWNICVEDSLIKIFECSFHKECRKCRSARRNLNGLFFGYIFKAKCSVDLAWSGKVIWFESLNVTSGFICFLTY